MTIGIYGGSFDPIHTGHAMLANFVAQCNLVDEVWITVNKRNPLKRQGAIATDLQRLEMATMVAKECEYVKVSDIELGMPSPSYTIETLRKLKEIHPDYQFKLIIGSDSLMNFKNWKNSADIINEFGLIVYPRPGYPLPAEEPDGMTFINGAPQFSVSSSLVREYLASGWNINYFVPVSVSNYIIKNKLYI